MTTSLFRSTLTWLAPALATGALLAASDEARQQPLTRAPPMPAQEEAVHVHYLEVVTPDVEATCAALAKLHATTFGKPVAELGGARTAALAGGGSIGVRPPLRPDEEPVVRPYVLVDDIAAATEAARAAGGEIAIGPLEIPGRGRFTIYVLGGIEHGLWQV